jgi:hypothetical protein
MNINLGVAQTVCNELKTIRSLKVRIDRYTSYAHYQKIVISPKVSKLLKGLNYIYSKLTGNGEKASCYLLPNYKKLRITVDKLLKEEGYLWESCTGRPWINIQRKFKEEEKEDRLLSVRLKKLSEQKIHARKAELKWRLTHEILEKNQKGYYIIFNTLTVEPKYYKMVWEKGSKIFRQYIYNINKLCKTHHTYFGVRETGELNGRLHIHCIHLLKEIPNSWKTDPNDSEILPLNREIHHAKALWKYGISQPIAVRFNTDDAYSRLGWRWPLESTISGPVKATNPAKMASYISKYINKEQKKGVQRWKTKISRNLGIYGIRKAMHQMEDRELEILANLQTSRLATLNNKMIPKQIMIKEATREIIIRMKGKQNSFLTKISEIIPQPSIIKQWNCLTQKNAIHNWQNIPFTETRSLREMESYEINQIIEKLEKGIKCVYNPKMDSSANHIKNPHKKSILC